VLIERFLQYIENKGLALTKVEHDLGLSNGYLGKHRDRKGSVGSDIIEKIVEFYPDIDIEWLVRGKQAKILVKNKKTLIPDNGIPFYENLPASAGDFNAFFDQKIPTSFLDIPQLKGCDAILPVYGTSMKGIIEAGDLVAIKEIKSRNEFDPSLPYLVITDEHRMIKYLRVDDEDESIIWAESSNHHKIKLLAENIKKVYAIKGLIRFF